MNVTGPVDEDTLLLDACFTEVQWRLLMSWAAAKGGVVYEALELPRSIVQRGTYLRVR